MDDKTANKMLWITEGGAKVARMTDNVTCPVLDRPERYEYAPQVRHEDLSSRVVIILWQGRRTSRRSSNRLKKKSFKGQVCKVSGGKNANCNSTTTFHTMLAVAVVSL